MTAHGLAYIRAMFRYIVTLLFSAFVCCLSAQPYLDNVAHAFDSLPTQSHAVPFRSNLKSKVGGHLQGIQRIGAHDIITASSAKQAYYFNIASTGEGHIVKIDTLSEMPYRHAGGCQASGGVIAIGVEDNIAKDKAKVLLVNVKDNKAIAVIERNGNFERCTAGAVGYARLMTDQYLIAVGDWDSKHIDFYLSKPNNVASFDSVATYKADTISTWGSYQSVNILQQADGRLYMIGFCLDSKGRRADLFSLILDATAKLQVIKSRYFKTTNGASFRYGAGVHVSYDKKLSLIACQRNMKKGWNYINVWQQH